MGTLNEHLPLGFDTMVYQVEAGTVIEHNGERMTVTDSSVVMLENKLYCTERFFNLIKENTAARLS